MDNYRIGNKFAMKHGQKGTKAYKAFFEMHERCYNPKYIGYKNYGGRGIGIDYEPWRNKNVLSFISWANANGIADELVLDRIDNDKGYSPDNCRWVTRIISQRNRRLMSTNKTGCSGVHWNSKAKKYKATIKVNKKQIYLGYFDNLDDAILARKKAELLYWAEL